MKYFFIINPQSRNGRSGKKTEGLLTLLARTGFSFDYALTASLDHAYLLSQKANLDKYDSVVAVGGDGTINRVLNGFFNEDGQRISSAIMGAIHTGTSPDFCKSYCIPRQVEDAVRTIAAGKTTLIRAGKISCAASPGSSAENTPAQARFFGCCANIGLGASLARTANSGIRKYAGDLPGTFLSLIKVLGHYRPVDVSLTIDGNRRTVTRVYDIAVGRTHHIASGIQVRHTLGKLDTRLYVVAVRDLSPWNIIPVLSLLYAGRPVPADCPCISLEYGSRIEISCEGSAEAEFDGDPAGYCPCVITTAPDHLELITGESHAG